MSHQAIETKNFRGTAGQARIKATADAGSIIIPWDHAMNVEDNHRAAIRAFVERMGWHGTWVVGATRGGFVGVCAKREHREDYRTPHPQAVDPLASLIIREG